MKPAPHRSDTECGHDGCGRQRGDAIGNGDRWHLIHGNVWAAERGSFVVWSSAGSCDEHAPALVDQVQADVDQWDERWQVVHRLLDYGTNDYSPEVIDAEGFGTPDGVLF